MAEEDLELWDEIIQLLLTRGVIEDVKKNLALFTKYFVGEALKCAIKSVFRQRRKKNYMELSMEFQ